MSERIHSIDTFRAVAVFFVVVAHVQPFRGFGAYGNHVYFLLDTIGQFDVPFFFATSGYFLAKTATPHSVTSILHRSLQKLGSMYAFGILVFVSATAGIALLQGVDVTQALAARRLGNLSLVEVLYYGNGVAVILWFLTALFFSLCFVSVFIYARKTRYLLPVATVPHVVGLIGENYPMIAHVPVLTRDALFFGFFYVALGYQLRSGGWTPNENRSHVYLGAVGLLTGLQLVEQYAIGYLVHDSTLRQQIHSTEYTVATVFVVFALFTYLLSNPNLGKNTVLPKIGRYAVGIYLVHMPLYHLFLTVNQVWGSALGIDVTGTLLWHLAITPLVYGLSLGIYLLLARIGAIDVEGSHLPWLIRLPMRLESKLSDGSSEVN